MSEINIKDYLLLEDDKSREIAFVIEAKLLSYVMFDDCYAWTNERYKREGKMFILKRGSKDRIVIHNVPEKAVDNIVRTKQIFISTVQNDKMLDCFVLPAHRMTDDVPKDNL